MHLHFTPQLDTFLRVADAGSFSKAAEEAYITPTAVIKQINVIDFDFYDVNMFNRCENGNDILMAVKDPCGRRLSYRLL